MKPALHDLFMYLSDEVFTNMELTQKEWLLSFSIFPVFSERLIQEFYGAEAVAVLQELSERHVFIQPLEEEGTYRYHAIFQQFLESKWIAEDLIAFPLCIRKHQISIKRKIMLYKPFFMLLKAEMMYLSLEYWRKLGHGSEIWTIRLACSIR